jgi:hypothetical protein
MKKKTVHFIEINFHVSELLDVIFEGKDRTDWCWAEDTANPTATATTTRLGSWFHSTANPSTFITVSHQSYWTNTHSRFAFCSSISPISIDY